MNIEQLNGSGQHLSVFITTAILTLVVTGGSWFLIEQMNSYRKWRRRSSEQQYDGKTQFTVAVRLALIAWLVSNRHTDWMFGSGAWWRIAIDHKSRIKDYIAYGSPSRIIPEVPLEDLRRLTAGEYVSKYSKGFPDWVVKKRFVGGWHIRWMSPREEDE